MKQTGFLGYILGASVLIVAQYILAFFVFKLTDIIVLQVLGWIVWAVSVYFGFAPILILGRRGGVAQGKSYIHTTRLVTTNLYAIIRHPQYVAGMLFSLGMLLLCPHWLVIVLGAISIVLIYLDLQGADREASEKFGAEYRAYMQQVPQMNIPLGIYRLLRRKLSRDKNETTGHSER